MGQTRFTTENFVLGSSTVGNEQVKSSANIDVSKLRHLHKVGTNFDLAIGGTVASREEIVFVASTTGTIRGFYCTFNVGGTTGDSDFDLKVNGASVLSAVVNFANGDADTSVETGTINTPALAVDDIVSISVTRNSAHDGTGPFAWVEIEETAA
jgi:hypothetical protein